MMLGTVRRDLGRSDAQLALRLLARGSHDEHERLSAALADSGIDTLLDDPRLLAALIDSPAGAQASLPLFCYVAVRQAMRTVGEHDRLLADYVASIVLRFGLGGRATRIADGDDEVYATLADLLADAERGDARRTFLVRVHLGNYALWVSGLFPDRVEQRRWRRGGPDLAYYEEMGRRGFQMAAAHRLAGEYGVEALFAGVAERFGAIRCALTRLSDTLLFPHQHSPERLMRQVRDEMQYRLAS